MVHLVNESVPQKMVIWRYRVPAISSPRSVGTFLKHFPASLQPRPRPVRDHPNGVGAARAASFSALEALSHQQKQQIDHYVDALLQWNQVSFLFVHARPRKVILD